MTLIAGRATGHLDLKDTGGEEKVVEMALDILGPGNFVVTTLEDRSVAAIKTRFPAVPAALSLGRDLNEVPRARRAATRLSELFPMRRLRACRADWVAVHRRLAAAGVLARCHRAGIKTMIWTVDEDAEMRRWLADPRVAVLITNRPARRGGDALLAGLVQLHLQDRERVRGEADIHVLAVHLALGVAHAHRVADGRRC